MSDRDDLQRILISVLRSNPCLDIKFQNAGITIMGYGYGYVASMIEDRKATVAMGDTGSFTAKYDSHSNTMTFRRDALKTARTPDGRATMVHEATHAVIDAVAPGRRIGFGDEEVSAYLAQTIYSLNCGDPVNKQGPFAEPLFKLATKIRNSGTIYPCTAAETDYLRKYALWFYGQIAKAEGKQVPQFNDPDGIPNRP